MPTIRDTIQEQLLARLQALPGWTAARRVPGEGDANRARVALLLDAGETALAGDTMTVQKELLLNVAVMVRAEDAPAELGGNAERYLADEMAKVEAALFTPAWLPGGEELRPRSGGVVAEADGNQIKGLIQLAVVYRHNIGDPSTFNPVFVT